MKEKQSGHQAMWIMALFVIFLKQSNALDSYEVAALKDLQAQFGTALLWSGEPSCKWNGVSCTSDSHVTSLDLGAGNPISGYLPPSIGNLWYMTILRCNSYDPRTCLGLYGSIPNEIGNLFQLLRLEFRATQLSGNLPKTMSNLVNLAYLRIANSSISTGLEFLPSLSQSLVELDLSYNPINLTFSLYPSLICPKLQLFNLSHTNFRFSASSSSRSNSFPLLRTLDLSYCPLANPIIVDYFSRLPDMTYLDLSYAQLSGPLPDSFYNIVNRNSAFANLQGNSLNGALPLWICQNILYYSGISGNATPRLALRGNRFALPLPVCCDGQMGRPDFCTPFN